MFQKYMVQKAKQLPHVRKLLGFNTLDIRTMHKPTPTSFDTKYTVPIN